MKQIEASGILNKVELWNLHCKSTLQERMLENQKPCTQSCMKVKFKKKKKSRAQSSMKVGSLNPCKYEQEKWIDIYFPRYPRLPKILKRSLHPKRVEKHLSENLLRK